MDALRLLDREAAAAYLSISTDTLDRLVHTGALHVVRLPVERDRKTGRGVRGMTRRILLDRRELDALVDSCRVVTGTRDKEVFRQVSNGEINRELSHLKRAFTLAVQSGKLLHKPHIALLREHNVRTGFFEREQFLAVCVHLPTPVEAVARFAYVTGWRIPSEVLPLEWRQIDFTERLNPTQYLAGTIRLDPDTTKNAEGRVFPFTQDLKVLLEAQYAEHLHLKKAGHIAPWVFVRLVACTNEL